MEEEIGQEDKTEEATPERREEFRERGQIAVSKELTSVLVLAAAVMFLGTYMLPMYKNLHELFIANFESLAQRRINSDNIIGMALEYWKQFLLVIVPVFLVTETVSVSSVLAQTRLNWSWSRLKPDFSRMNPLPGIARMFNMQAAVELIKTLGKTATVSIVAYLILRSEWAKMPGLMQWPIVKIWGYWGEITKTLFWSVAGFLLFIAGGDYLYSFFQLEKKLKMSKQEVKEEFKRRELDPHLKGRMRRMARDIATRKVIEKTKTATVLVTNPTHYSIALRYEMGMPAPIMVAKGIDFLALNMREVAKEMNIPIIENRPLARELYATVEEGQEIPDKLYKVVAEIIRYVFKLKGKSVPQKKKKTETVVAPSNVENTTNF